MMTNKIPSSRDIYIKINGKKVAVIESFKLVSTKTHFPVEEFSSSVPTAIILSDETHKLELKRIYFIGEGSFDFHSLSGFKLEIIKPDRNITYEDCEWETIVEATAINSPAIETITVISPKRSLQ